MLRVGKVCGRQLLQGLGANVVGQTHLPDIAVARLRHLFGALAQAAVRQSVPVRRLRRVQDHVLVEHDRRASPICGHGRTQEARTGSGVLCTRGRVQMFSDTSFDRCPTHLPAVAPTH